MTQGLKGLIGKKWIAVYGVAAVVALYGVLHPEADGFLRLARSVANVVLAFAGLHLLARDSNRRSADARAATPPAPPTA